MPSFLYAGANPTTLIDPSGHSVRSMTDGGSSGSTAAEKAADPEKYAATYVDPKDYISNRPSGGGATQPKTVKESPAPDRKDMESQPNMIGHVMVDAYGVPYSEGDASALYHMCLLGFDASTQAACASYRAWIQVANVDRIDLHMALDALGFVPLVGTLADITSGLLYLVEGDYFQAAASLAVAAPLGGDLLGTGRFAAKYGDDALDGLTSLGDDAATRADDLVTACKAGNSFTAATPVHLSTGGTVPIAEIEVGDTVEAMDPTTGETASYVVSATFVHLDTETGTVVIDGEAVETTPDHQFLTIGRGWVEAEDLRPGERVASVTDGPGLVGEMRWDGGPAMMYDLTVEQVHTFAVGEGGWVVHNLDCDPASFTLDAKGKVHGELPAFVPRDWTRAQMQEVAENLRESIARRQDLLVEIGEDAGHRLRVNDELNFLRQLEKVLGGK